MTIKYYSFVKLGKKVTEFYFPELEIFIFLKWYIEEQVCSLCANRNIWYKLAIADSAFIAELNDNSIER